MSKFNYGPTELVREYYTGKDIINKTGTDIIINCEGKQIRVKAEPAPSIVSMVKMGNMEIRMVKDVSLGSFIIPDPAPGVIFLVVEFNRKAHPDRKDLVSVSENSYGETVFTQNL